MRSEVDMVEVISSGVLELICEISKFLILYLLTFLLSRPFIVKKSTKKSVFSFSDK